jgi:hypothetical protein
VEEPAGPSRSRAPGGEGKEEIARVRSPPTT